MLSLKQFRIWLENEERIRTIRYYADILGLPIGFLKRDEAYQILNEGLNKNQYKPEAKDAFRLLHQELDRVRGRHFDDFFTKASQGDSVYTTEVDFVPEYDMDVHQSWDQVRSQYHGYFDRHIKTSIPTFGEIQDKKGHAIVQVFGNQQMHLLDIGGSEGSWARAISHMTNGNIKTDVVDPNRSMHDFYNSKGQTPGSRYIRAGFQQGWMEDDGMLPSFNSQSVQKRYDIIHESMVFQFMGPQRGSHIAEVKRMLKPNGLFLTEEKLKTDPVIWKENEEFKDRYHKSRYYTSKMLAQKEKVIAFTDEKKKEAEKQLSFPQDDEEVEVVGMANNMVAVNEFEKILKNHFRHVWQYWDSGNFKGYAASDDSNMVQKFIVTIGNTNSRFSRTKLPREVNLQEWSMPKFNEWLESSSVDDRKTIKTIILAVLPDEYEDLTWSDLRDKFGDAIVTAVIDAGHEVTVEDLEKLLDIIGPEWMQSSDDDWRIFY